MQSPHCLTYRWTVESGRGAIDGSYRGALIGFRIAERRWGRASHCDH